MRKHLAVLALSALTLVSCSGESPPETSADAAGPPTVSASADPPTATPPTSPLESSSPTASATRSLEVWFAYGETLFVTHRTVPSTPAVGRAAMDQLLKRPTEFEANAGVTTAIPPQTGLLGLTIEERIATVDLSKRFFTTNGSLGEQIAIAQVVHTLTQFPSVDAVSFFIEGEAVDASPGHGIDLSEPQTRKRWRDFLPSILVTRPSMGASLSSPVVVQGTSNVYEATLQMRLLDAEGHRLARAFTTATCGTGCRGTFEHELNFEVDREQHGVLEVWWASAEDGSREDVVQIAVTLEP